MPHYFVTSPGDPEVLYEYAAGVKELELSRQAYDQFFKHVLESSGGMLHHLLANLASRDLAKYVVVTAGETIVPLPYGFVFSDAAHGPAEIRKNAQGWLDVCTQQPGRVVVFAFHDILVESGFRTDVATIDMINFIFEGAGHTVLAMAHDGGLLYAVELKCAMGD